MPIKFAAKKIGWSQSDKGFVLRLLVSPDDDWTEAANAPLGSPFGVVMVPIDPESGVSTEASPGAAGVFPAGSHAGQQRDEVGKSRKPFHEMSRAQQAGILCNDDGFCLWLSVAHPLPEVKVAADAVRMICGVNSRADLSEDRVAGKKWDQLVTNFYEATGRMAEQRA